MKKQKLTPQQYRRANKVLMTALTVVYLIFVLVELNGTQKGTMGVMNYARMGIYVASAIAMHIFVRIKIEKKSAMFFMAILTLVDYTLLVLGNGPGAMAMVFPIVLVFMIYLNAPLVVIGLGSSFVICVIKAAMLKMAGDDLSFTHSNLIVMGIIVCFFGARLAINLIITFIQEDKKIIEDKAEEQARINGMVSELTDTLNKQFHGVVEELKCINESVEGADSIMNSIADSTQDTSDAVENQAEMTTQIHDKLERNTAIAENVKNITEELRCSITEGKKLSDELKEQSLLVDRNTTKISDTVEELVKNVEKVSNISASILNISSQTNLLALNASIEAARAGEAGRGFAVVADEIRKLAEETRVSTEQITEIINELIAVTNETKRGIDESAESINSQREKVERVNASFIQMEAGMGEVHDGVEGISGELGAVLQANKGIVDSISLLSEVTQEVSGGTKQSREALDNVCGSLQGFSDLIEGTFEQLQELRKTVEV